MKKIILCTMLLITTCLSACSGDSETVSEDNQPVENNIDVEDNKNASGNNTEDYSQSENNEDYKSGGISATSYESEWLGINFNFPPGYIVNWDLINASHELTEIQKSKYSEYQYLELSICKENDENVHFDIYVDFPKTNKTDQQAAEDIKNDIISAYENAEAQSNGSITIDSTWQEPVEYQIAGDIYIGSAETYYIKLIADVIKNLRKSHPNIIYHIHSGAYSEITEKLDKGLLDFGILIGNIDSSKYDYIDIPYKEVYGLLMRKDSHLSKNKFIEKNDLFDIPIMCPKIFFNNKIQTSKFNEWIGNE